MEAPHRVTAHSCRAQSTSMALCKDIPIQEMCRASTWSSIHTFCQVSSLLPRLMILLATQSSEPSWTSLLSGHLLMELLLGCLLWWSIRGTYTRRRRRNYLAYSNLSSLRCFSPMSALPPVLLPLSCGGSALLSRRNWVVAGLHLLYVPSFGVTRCCYVQV